MTGICGRIAWGAAALAAALGSAAAAEKFFIHVAEPVFTADQAARGKTIYAEQCMGCHGSNLTNGQFGSALAGATFNRNWSAQSPDALFTYIATRMPPSSAGSLTDKQYADVAAFILQANGIAPGKAELAPKRLAADSVRIGNQDAIYDAAQSARKALLGKLTPVTDALLRSPPESDWLHWRGSYEAVSHSPLKQITRENAGALRPAWTMSLPTSVNEITPLVHDGVLFIQSGTMVEALNAVTGEMLWQFVYPIQNYVIRDARPKGIGIYEDKIYAPTPNGHLVALDAKTGRLIWDRAVISREQGRQWGSTEDVGLSLNSAPLIAKGKVMVGVSRGHNIGGGSYIVGLDARTGEEVWRFGTIARPGEPGGDSWNGAPFEQRFGAGVWIPGSYDSERNLAFFGTGNTYDIGTLVVPQPRKGESGDALYTNTTLALDPDTGKRVWFFQHMHRELWDLDWAFERSLITLNRNGKPTDLVVTGGKPAIFDAIERDGGKYVFSKDVGLQNFVTAIDPVTGRKTTGPQFEPQSGKPIMMCPSASGARNWITTAYDPASKIFYIPLLENCMDYTWTKRSAEEIAKGGNDIRLIPRNRPNHDGKFGRIDAINLETGKTVWSHRQRAAMASSLLTTAGGVLFGGSFDRLFRAYDAATGEVLWETPLNAPPNSSPITYSVAGEQYVAVVAGGGGPIDGATANLTPEIYNPPANPTLWVFKLPARN